MNPMTAAVVGALISGVTMYAVGGRASQNDALVEKQALVQTLDGQYLAAPAPARVVRTQSRPQVVTRAAERSDDVVIHRDEDVRPERSKTKTALIIGGSAAGGAGVGAVVGGKKGALIGAAIGGGAASIYEAIKRR